MSDLKAKKTITLDRMKDNESEKGDGKSYQGTDTKLEHGGKKEEEEMDAQNQIKEMQRKIEASLETLRSIGISESEEGSFTREDNNNTARNSRKTNMHHPISNKKIRNKRIWIHRHNRKGNKNIGKERKIKGAKWKGGKNKIEINWKIKNKTHQTWIIDA